ncbi:hypothetical protein HAX54_010226 [Datura stramonium]|uniref:Uncharacterized protein n=1 Tax=Datura stramonium TaxID=4076 RepID=A0ABS8RWK1_DATST|nr:hypothetical protein [Datura stramonium]
MDEITAGGYGLYFGQVWALSGGSSSGCGGLGVFRRRQRLLVNRSVTERDMVEERSGASGFAGKRRVEGEEVGEGAAMVIRRIWPEVEGAGLVEEKRSGEGKGERGERVR